MRPVLLITRILIKKAEVGKAFVFYDILAEGEWLIYG
jgi:hypothetical protein